MGFWPKTSLILSILLTGSSLLFVATGTHAGEDNTDYWWYKYPTYVESSSNLEATHARVVNENYCADPTWGYYGQHLNRFHASHFGEAKQRGARWITWIEGFGDCCIYAAAFHQDENGAYDTFENAPLVPCPKVNRWGWNEKDLAKSNVIRWIGIHNTTENEDIAGSLFTREAMGLRAPTYPDGTPAVGELEGKCYPMSLRVYDASCSKDINGVIYYSSFIETKAAPGDGRPIVKLSGLYSATVGSSELPQFKGKKPGEEVIADHLSLPKDAASPFWIDYFRPSIRVMAEAGIDGVWCDNFSPWDNFNASPVRKAFGDWSVAGFREYLAKHVPSSEREKAGIEDPKTFDIREHLKEKARAFGAVDPANHGDRAWRDPRWLDNLVWNHYKVFKQEVGRKALRSLYHVIKEEARNAGRPDFAVFGNDIPLFSLGWVREDYLGVVASEISCGWGLSTGSRGILLPPVGKMAVVYRAALEHQKAPYAAMWYYMPDSAKGKPGMGRVLLAEAFANSAFLKYGPSRARVGTLDVHREWNDFVHGIEQDLGRRTALADVGVLFSPDNQLSLVLPGCNAPDFNRQSHMFGHWGFATAMIDAHIPYRVVTDWNLSKEELEGLRAFVIPSAECLDDSMIPVLEEWVRAGGRLVITGPSGYRRGTQNAFTQRSNSILAPLVGRSMTESKKMRRVDSQDREWIETEAAVDVELGKTSVSSRASISSLSPGCTVHTHILGEGTVIWSPEEPGVEYYLKEKKRELLLNGLTDMVGPSRILDARNLPVTVGAFCWQHRNDKIFFADLVNYSIAIESDYLTKAQDLRFRLRIPQDAKGIDVCAFSPQKDARVEAKLNKGWVEVHVPQLEHYLCVRIASH